MVMTSDKGLAGAFNSNLLGQTFSFFKKKSEHTEVSLILMGKKAVTYFKKLSFPVRRVYPDQMDKLSTQDLKELAHFLMRLYILNEIDAVYVAYNEFKSILAPRITITKLLPLEPPEKHEDKTLLPPDWEPEALPLIGTLLPLYIEAQIRHFFFESSAAEHAARMMAMDNATRNADDLASDLMLILNKIRQASITKELLEIMTAVEALAKR
jgi:F-type H+-transporting ATPase subunit gamma